MTDDDRAKLREMQAEIDALGRQVAAGVDGAQAAMDAAKQAQADFLRGLGFTVR
jgi:hypothetical protein